MLARRSAYARMEDDTNGNARMEDDTNGNVRD